MYQTIQCKEHRKVDQVEMMIRMPLDLFCLKDVMSTKPRALHQNIYTNWSVYMQSRR